MKLLGPRSETLSDLQLQLLADEEPGTTLDEVEAEARRTPLPEVAAASASAASGAATLARKSAACRGSRPLRGANLPGVRRRDRRHRLRRERAVGPAAGALLRACNQARKARLPMLPGRNGDYAAPGAAHRGKGLGQRPRGGGDGGRQIRGPSAAVPAGGDPGAGSRSGDRPGHVGWVGDARGEMLGPVVSAMRQDLLRGSYLQADETIVPVQMHDKRGADHQAYLWQYGKPGGETVFDFCWDEGARVRKSSWGQWEGILQTDGYQAYESTGGPKLVHVGCWAHARRKFVDAVKVNPDDGAAVQMVIRMDALFLVDRDARKKQMTGEERLAARRQHAEVWAEEIRQECMKLRATVLPKGALGKAITYTLNQWSKLRRCFDYGEVELSNNLAENSMRPVTLGRKNWLHVGSAKAGPKVAAIISIVESCRRLGVPVKDYMLYVLPGMDRRKLSEMAQLTPGRWSASRT